MKWYCFSYVIVQNKIRGFLSTRKEVIGGERRNIIDKRGRRQRAGGERSTTKDARLAKDFQKFKTFVCVLALHTNNLQTFQPSTLKNLFACAKNL
jgi:hypothetical protein